MYLGDGVSGSTILSPLANRGRIIIFQSPPAHLRSRMGSGWGQIRMGSRTCHGVASQLGQCPWNGDRPCLEKGIPCEIDIAEMQTVQTERDATACEEMTDINLGVTVRLEESTGKVRANVTWQIPSLMGNCAITFHKLTRQQLDLGNCPGQLQPDVVPIDLEKRFKNIKRLLPHAWYNVTLLVRNQAGMTHVASQDFRTPKAVPGVVDSFTVSPGGNNVRISWNELPCEQRNGENLRYKYSSWVNNKLRRTVLLDIGERYFQIKRLSTGKKWRFEVRACNEIGCGKPASRQGVMQ